jgi:hypothetical protein
MVVQLWDGNAEMITRVSPRHTQRMRVLLSEIVRGLDGHLFAAEEGEPAWFVLLQVGLPAAPGGSMTGKIIL